MVAMVPVTRLYADRDGHARFEDTEIPVTVSVGIATLTPEIQELTDFVKLADDNLYGAKAAGRNRVVG